MLMLPSSLLHLALLKLPCQILSPPLPTAPCPTPTLVMLLSPDTSLTLSCCSLPVGSSSAQAFLAPFLLTLISLPFLQPSKGDYPLPSLLPPISPVQLVPLRCSQAASLQPRGDPAMLLLQRQTSKGNQSTSKRICAASSLPVLLTPPFKCGQGFICC